VDESYWDQLKVKGRSLIDRVHLTSLASQEHGVLLLMLLLLLLLWLLGFIADNNPHMYLCSWKDRGADAFSGGGR
jgi:hypothetical protein